MIGAVSILPTLLYLTTTVVKECGVKSPEGGAVVANSPPVQAALHCLRLLNCHPHSRDPRSMAQWNTLLQSALAKVIDFTKTGTFNI